MEKVIKCVRKNFVYIIAASVMICTWIPYLLSACYVLPCSDDFGNANNYIERGGHSLRNIYECVKSVYWGWQGTYSGELFAGVLDPLGRFGIDGNSYVLFCTSILFFFLLIALFFMLFSFHTGMTKQNSCLLVSVCIVMCFNCRILTQMMFWFIGAAVYTLPVLFGFCSIIMQMLSFKQCPKRKKIRDILLGSLFGFIACGGVLQVTGYICFIFLICLCYSIYKKENIKIYMISFFIVLSGALINVAAPGNYARRAVIDREISLLQALFYSFIAVFEELKYLASSSYLPWMLLCLFILDMLLLPVIKEKFYHPIVVGIVVVISWLISVFPVCYGYGSSGLMDRGKELLDIVMVVGLCFWMNSIVTWLKKKSFVLKKESILILLIFSLISIGYQQAEMPVTQVPSVVCFSQLVSGDLREYHDAWHNILDTIEKSEDAVVKVPIRKSIYENKRVIRGPGLTDSFEDWHNTAIATFFGKERVRVEIYDDSEVE